MLPAPQVTRPSIPRVRFALLGQIPHGISTRHGGVSPDPYATLNMGLSTGDAEENVVRNRDAFARSLGVSLRDVAVGRLSHGNAVSVFGETGAFDVPEEHVSIPAASERTERVFMTDGVVSNVRGLHFLLTFADCVPLLFLDRKRGVVGAAHAGWRGTALSIATAVVHRMRASFGTDPRDIVVGVGPSIGPCCYTVGPDVLTTFRAHGAQPIVSASSERDRVQLDLWSTNERQLVQAGVPASSIENPRICTSCHVSSFFSHRAERARTGRFAACIGLL